MIDPDRLHNPRVIAGTVGGFEGLQRFQSVLVDPLKNLLPIAVEVEGLALEPGRAFAAHVKARAFFVDDTDLESGRLRLAGPFDRFELLAHLCAELSPELKALARAIERAIAQRFVDAFDVPCRGRILRFGRRPLILGVLNVTPDSFSDGGRFAAPDRAIERGFAIVAEGAHVLDVGAESTRPGAKPIPASEEWARLEPVLKTLCRELKVPISIDTMKADVAERALDIGVAIVNDVSGLDRDPRMAGVAAKHQAALILNHMKGTPRTMQESPRYDDPVAEIARALRERSARAVEAGVPVESLLLDPGVGFGKRLEDNLDVLARLAELRSLGRPLVVGCSRKSFLGQLTGRPVDERAPGTAATTALAAISGAKLVRVHDVAATRDVLTVLDAVDARVRMA